MANTMDKLAKELKAQMTASDERKPKPYDAQAEVLRVEDGTAWVHIPGGVEETPVRLTINAKKGDMVNIHVANGAAWITGNSTSPPTDDSTAFELNQKTSKNLFVLNEKVTNEFNNAWTEITQNSEEIKLKASQATVDTLTGRVATAESSIEQNAHDITLKVSTSDYTGDNIVSKINLQPDTVKIEAKNVEIDGTAIFENSDFQAKLDAEDFATSSDLPTKVSDLTNDSGYQTASQVSSAVSSGVSGKADKTDAIARQQRIYYRKTASGAPSKNTTWLSTSGTGYGNWSLKISQLTNGSTKYPYLYTAVQTQTVSQQAAGSTCSCSDVLLDDSTTVIDGGNITTGTIDANRITASVINAINDGTGTINADKINVSQITVGELSDGSSYSTTTQMNEAIGTAIDDIAVGGRNLLHDTRRMGTWPKGARASFTADKEYNYGTLVGSTADWGARLDTATYTLPLAFLDGSPMILSFEYKSTVAWSTQFFTCAGSDAAPGTTGGATRTKYTTLHKQSRTLPATSEWTKVSFDCKELTPSMLTSGSGDVNSWFLQIYLWLDNITVDLRKIKLEKGTVATDWSAAPEDLVSGGRNYWLALDESLRTIGKGRVSYEYDGDGGYILTCTTSGTSMTQIYTSNWIPCEELAGKHMVFHADSIEATNSSADERVIVSLHNSSGTGIGSFYLNANELCKTIQFPNTLTEMQLVLRMDQNGASAVGDKLTVIRPKLELGLTPTDWTPAPEDVSAVATNYITAIDNDGIRVHAANNPTSNYAKIDATGMDVYKGGVSVAKYGDTSRIGKIAASNGNIRTNSTGMDLYVNTTKVGSFHQQTGYTPEDRADTYNNALFIDAAEYFAVRSSSTLKPMIETNGTEVDINFGGSSLITADDFNAAEGGGPVTFELWGHDSSEITDPDPDVDFSTFINVYGGIDDGDGGVTGVGLGVGDDGNQHGVWSAMKERWLIGATNTGEIMCPGVYLNTTSGGSNVRILGTNADSFDYMMKRYASSSRRYKTEIDDISDDALNPSRLYDARVVQFKYKDGYLGEDDQRNGKLVNGFIAEELDDIYPIAVQYENGLPEDWEPKFLIPPMLKLIQDQKKKIDELEARLEKLEKKL